MNIRNKSKHLWIAGFSLVTSVALAGTVTGSFAWYNSVNSLNVNYIGVTSSTTDVLQIHRGDDDNVNSLSRTDVRNLIHKQSLDDLGDDDLDEVVAGETIHQYGSHLSPVTSLKQDRGQALESLYDAPQMLRNDWYEAYKSHYIRYTLPLRAVSGSDASAEAIRKDDAPVESKTVYLSDLTLLEDTPNDKDGKADISNAIRVQITSKNSADGLNHHVLMSKNGATISTYGALDLNGDGKADTYHDRYTFDSEYVFQYGRTQGDTQSSYAIDKVRTIDSESGLVTGGMPLGVTPSEGYLNLVVTIWLEGWEKLDESLDYPTWSSNLYSETHFNIGMRFATGPDQN